MKKPYLPLIFLVISVLSGPGELSAGYDIIIRGGTIYDGSGGVPFVGDVAVSADRIVAVGPGLEGPAASEIDASGLAIAPGFINTLSWATETLLVDGRAMSDVKQGVTLEVFGEGWSMGPLTEEMKDDPLPPEGSDLQYEITWSSLEEYLEGLVSRGISPNVASFVGATTVRINVLGYEDRPPTPTELEAMQSLVAEAMREGALGVGSAPMYAPGSYAQTEELVALSQTASRYGGTYISHIRSESTRLLEAVSELITISREADIPAQIYHFKAAGKANWPKLDEAIGMIESARAQGLNISANMYPYTAAATGLFATMPLWVQEGGIDAWIARLQDPQIRARVKEAMLSPGDNWDNWYVMAGSAENIRLIGFESKALKPLVGKTLAEIAGLRGQHPADTIIDLVIEDHSSVLAAYFVMSEENVRKKARLNWISFGSDEGAYSDLDVFLTSSHHPRAYGTFARVLGRFVRDEHLLTLAEAIRRMAALPAANLKIRDRGQIRAGYFADLAIFDPAKIDDHATFEDFHQYASGMVHVFVNGVQVLKNGNHTGATPGQIVRGPGWIGWEETQPRDPAGLH